MSNKNAYQKLGNRVSEEAQLLAEEKWIVDALAKIKKQRNSLQIERLHLENLKTKIKANVRKEESETAYNISEDSMATTSAVNLMQNVAKVKFNNEEMEKDFTVDEEFCNEQKLNLLVPRHSYAQSTNNIDFNMEEDEEESDDDVAIDINMLMNGALEEETKYKTGKCLDIIMNTNN